MNPFDLRGPEFLFFYFCFSLVVISAIVILRRRAESGPAPKIDLGDPYLIAYLRGGEDEALRVAVMSLVGRGMLIMGAQFVCRAANVTDNMVEHPIEREALKRFSAPDEAISVFKDDNLKSTLQPYRQKLEAAGLLPDSAARNARWVRLLIALMALGIVGVIKIQIGISLQRPVAFLVFMMIAAMIIVAVCSFPRLTVRGKATLVDIAILYSGLERRVNLSSPGSAPAELAMFAAVFGFTALASTPFEYTMEIFNQPRGSSKSVSSTSSSSCGSSCGSSVSSSSCSSSDGGSSCGGSSDGGSSCGGGGCGGCGSS